MRFRNSTQIRILLLEAAVVFYALAAGATASDSPSALLEFSLFLPTLAVLLILFARNSAKARGLSAPFVDIALSLPVVALVPHYHFTKSALLAWTFLAALRAWFPHRSKAVRKQELETPLTLEKLRWNAIELEVRAREWSSRGYIAVAAGAGLLGLSLPYAKSFQAQIASVLFMLGAAYVAWIIHQRGAPDSAPLGGAWKDYSQYYRTELRRQSVLLQRAWHFYFGALIPCALLLLQDSTLYACFGLIYVLLLAELNYRALEWIDVQTARLEHSTLDSDNPPTLMSKRPSIYGEHGRL